MFRVCLSDGARIFVRKNKEELNYGIFDGISSAGIVIGVATFLIIGIFHPLVTKGEYYFGVRIWWIFLLMGIAAVIGSVLVENIVWSTLLAVWGASSFWSIGELFEQRKRVEKGWFPKRPEKKER